MPVYDLAPDLPVRGERRPARKGPALFPGLALYDGTWEQPDEVVHYWERKYGLVRL